MREYYTPRPKRGADLDVVKWLRQQGGRCKTKFYLLVAMKTPDQSAGKSLVRISAIRSIHSE